MISRSFLKWVGGKANAMEHLWEHLPREGARFIEPFMGSATVSLNMNYEDYELYDVNKDLIFLCRWASRRPGSLIQKASQFFCAANNSEASYYALRQAYNRSTDMEERAVLFLYLNKHGYNGLSRYNQKGVFNVPYGRYKGPRFPEKEIVLFHQKMKRAKFACRSLEKLRLRGLSEQTVIYNDPPYLPMTKTANFTAYSEAGFSINMQALLDKRAKSWQQKGAQVFVSNHAAPILDAVYRNCRTKKEFLVDRSVSCKGDKRLPASEVILMY